VRKWWIASSPFGLLTKNHQALETAAGCTIFVAACCAGRLRVPRQSDLADGNALKFEGTYTMNRQRSSFFGMRTHHFAIALIAILIAIALVSNHYLW
jgi:hypothetical protein